MRNDTMTGKGSKPRPSNKPKYDRRHDAIRWASERKKNVKKEGER